MLIKRKIIQLFDKLLGSQFMLFLLCNLIYSVSTFIINLFLPIILSKSIFNEFIYLFQMNLFMVSMSGLGLTTGLLKNHLVNKTETHSFFTFTSILVSIGLLIIGFFPNNPISIGIKINELGHTQHLLFYISVIFTNLFLYNRAILNSEKSFVYMLKSVSLITLFRLIGLIIIAKYYSDSISTSLLILFILPFLIELVFFIRKTIITLKTTPFIINKKYMSFISFCFQVFISGALFLVADRLFLIYIKGEDETLSGILSFAYGFIGVISVFNMSFTNYFLGKINPSNIEEIIEFKNKIKSFFGHFITMTLIIILILSLFIYFAYAEIATTLIAVLIILILKTALVSYFGLTNILSKTLNIQHIDLIINLFRILLVYTTISLNNNFNINFITLLILISLIMIIGDFVLFIFVLRKIKANS